MANKLNKLISGRFSVVVFFVVVFCVFFVLLCFVFRGLIGGKNDRYV